MKLRAIPLIAGLSFGVSFANPVVNLVTDPVTNAVTTGVGIESSAVAVSYFLQWTGDGAGDQSFSDTQVINTEAEGQATGQLTAIIIDGGFDVATNKISVTAQTTAAWNDLAF